MSLPTTSFCQELRQEHASLLDHLAQLEQAIESANGTTVANLLKAMQQHLLRHFGFEEQDGYMNHILDRAPQLHRKVEGLLAEHREMAHELADLIAATNTLSSQAPLPGAFRHRVRQLLIKVRIHEAHENQLVQETTNQELGTED